MYSVYLHCSKIVGDIAVTEHHPRGRSRSIREREYNFRTKELSPTMRTPRVAERVDSRLCSLWHL